MMSMKFARSRSGTGKLADVELHFLDGDLAGLRLGGFSVWDEGDLHPGPRPRVRMPGQSYTINGAVARTHLLRAIGQDVCVVDALKDEILDAYREWATASGQ